MAGDSAALVGEGWEHFRLQRPLAAWASWQKALRRSPGNADAAEALESLETAADLPGAARASYRFQNPSDPARRAKWDARLQGRGLDDLNVAAGAFAAIADDDPDDAEARLNQALCLAWLGRNVEAAAALDGVVRTLAASHPERAADAWTIAEVLRLGAGAEPLADDLKYVWTVESDPPRGMLDRWPNLRPVTVPEGAEEGARPLKVAEMYEWLDRPPLVPGAVADLDAWKVPMVLATVVVTPGRVRLSSTDSAGFERVFDPPLAGYAEYFRSARREAAPLPISWADLGLARYRLPDGLDPARRADLARGVVERAFEVDWVRRPRAGLDGRTPVEAARAAAKGDAVARAKLAAVVRFAEQLGERPNRAALYLGYPFDRLRRRLDLLTVGPEGNGAVAGDDVTCMSESELTALDPSPLDDHRLAEAFASASAFSCDALSDKFASILLERTPEVLRRADLEAVVAPLVRDALGGRRPSRAIEVIRRASSVTDDPRLRRTLTLWSAEVYARSGRPTEALAAYRSLVEQSGPDERVEVAIDGAETLLDNDLPEEARALLVEVDRQARGGSSSRIQDLVERAGESPPS